MDTTTLWGMGVRLTHVASDSIVTVTNQGDQGLNLFYAFSALRADSGFLRWYNDMLDASSIQPGYDPFAERSVVVEVWDQENDQWKPL